MSALTVLWLYHPFLKLQVSSVKLCGVIILIGLSGYLKHLFLMFFAAESRDNHGNELLISPEFLKNCRETFSIPIKAVENGVHEFAVKHINILDPLKDSNNLGRSVSKGT